MHKLSQRSNTASNTNAELQANNAIQTDRFLTYSYYGKTPQLNVYDKETALWLTTLVVQQLIQDKL